MMSRERVQSESWTDGWQTLEGISNISKSGRDWNVPQSTLYSVHSREARGGSNSSGLSNVVIIIISEIIVSGSSPANRLGFVRSDYQSPTIHVHQLWSKLCTKDGQLKEEMFIEGIQIAYRQRAFLPAKIRSEMIFMPSEFLSLDSPTRLYPQLSRLIFLMTKQSNLIQSALCWRFLAWIQFKSTFYWSNAFEVE